VSRDDTPATPERSAYGAGRTVPAPAPRRPSQAIGRITPVKVPAPPQQAPAQAQGHAQVREDATPPVLRVPPPRPPVVHPSTAPVLATMPPPFTIRCAQLLWVVGIALGGFIAVYLFVIRQTQLPLIADVVRTVTVGRPEETYEAAADIIFWIFFGATVVVVLAQITLLVSFMGRRRRIRWWQLATWVIMVGLLLFSRELVAVGDRGAVLFPLLAIWCGVVLLALICSILPPSITWSARQYDLRPGPTGPSHADL
jgi:hypothetical protein